MFRNLYKLLAKQEGISTVEILIAFTIIVLVFSTAILVVFGNQKLSVDAQTGNDALYIAQAKLEKARKTEFSALIDETEDGQMYDTVVDVELTTPCVKKVTVTVNYLSENRPQSVVLTTYVAGINEAITLSGNCDPAP